MDASLGDLYDELGIEGVSTRFSMAVMFLADGDATIRSLAERCGVTHSAMSQSVTAMRAAGLVESRPGQDARSRVVSLTERGASVVPVLRAEWDATEAAIADLEDELPYAPSRLAEDLAEAVRRRSFADRVRQRMPRA